MNKEAVKSILNSQGWLEIENELQKTIIEEKTNYKTDGKSNEQIVTDIKARELARKIIDNFLKKLSRIKNEVKKENIVYK